MVRVIESRIISGNVSYIEMSCLSTDTKPTADICTGSLALEVDTGDVYAFDEVGGEWGKIAELGGGGGESLQVPGALPLNMTREVPVIEVNEDEPGEDEAGDER